MNLPRISIVTPSYNQGSLLEQTIDSVLSQKYQNFEYVIIDGGSTDNSADIIKKYQKHLKFWVSECDRGQSHAINKGIKYCTGDIFNWINSDDYYSDGAFNHIADTFATNSNFLVITGKERAFDAETDETLSIHEGTNYLDKIEKLIYHGIIDQPTTFWKMEVVKNLGELPENLHFAMDSYWWSKFLLLYGKGYIGNTEQLLTHFRIHPDSKSISQQSKFETERFAIRLGIARALNFHPDICTYLESMTHIDIGNLFNDCASIKKKNIRMLESVFSGYIYSRYYMNYDYPRARKCFKLSMKSADLGTRIILDYIKLMLVPPALLNLFRGSKLSVKN